MRPLVDWTVNRLLSTAAQPAERGRNVDAVLASAHGQVERQQKASLSPSSCRCWRVEMKCAIQVNYGVAPTVRAGLRQQLVPAVSGRAVTR